MLRYYVRDDATGALLYEVRSSNPRREVLPDIQARLPAGQTALDATTSPRPPMPAAPPDPLAPKRARLRDLRAKGWANLTLTEKDEARVIAFDIGAPSPPAA